LRGGHRRRRERQAGLRRPEGRGAQRVTAVYTPAGTVVGAGERGAVGGSARTER
jgi:hypothetical protein